MKKLKGNLILLFCITLCGAGVQMFAQEKVKIKEALKSFDSFYDKSLRSYGIVGSSFMLIHDNRVLDKRFYGTAHIENKIPIDEKTTYHWASITKTFTAIAIMQLRDRGKLNLDDPVIKYIPELKQIHNTHGDTSEITIRQLMSHSAGFRSSTFPWGRGKEWSPAEPTKWEQITAMLPYTEVEFKPGNKFSYSNLGIVFLGRIIELVTGDDYEVYINKNIFKPLEMYRSYFDATPYYLLRHRSHSYYLLNGDLKPGRFDMNTGITVSNGGLNAPFEDMVKYMQFLLGVERDKATYDFVLKRSSLEEMWKPVLPVDWGEVPNGRNRREFIGLSFFIEENYGMRFIGHSGGQNGFITHFYLQPETRTAYLIAFNTYVGEPGKDPSELTRQLDREIKEKLFENVFPLFKDDYKASR